MNMKKDSTIYFKTKNGNAYLYDFNKETFLNSLPIFEDSDQIIRLSDNRSDNDLDLLCKKSAYTKEEIAQYLDEICFLRNHGYFSIFDKSVRTATKINGKIVRENISSVKHLVFEVTESCNLRCYYCGYGKLYNAVEGRYSEKLPVEKAMALIDYLASFWKEDKSRNKAINISFYGGEPLLNFDFIQQMVGYISDLQLFESTKYSITTNGMLLLKHIDYLVEKDFSIDVSLDGNRENNRFRVDLNNNNSFDVVIDALEKIREKYPEFFSKNINFQSVLSSANSVDSITRFFKEKFDKTISILELNTSNVKNQPEFDAIFQDYAESLWNASEEVRNNYFLNAPEKTRFGNMIVGFLVNAWRNYTHTPKAALIQNQKRLITGTCSPFWKKMFITAKGNMMACERINYDYILGEISDDNCVRIDFDAVAAQYNRYYGKLMPQCAQCYSSPFCVQCMFYIDNLDKKPICKDFMNKKEVAEYLSNAFSFIEDYLETVYSMINCTFYE